jgi:hypothetical protein
MIQNSMSLLPTAIRNRRPIVPRNKMKSTMATTAASGVLGARLAHQTPAHTAEGTVPDRRTPASTARLQPGLRVLQWATPALTGAIVVLGAQQGEQQKAGQVLTGAARRTLSDVVNAIR